MDLKDIIHLIKALEAISAIEKFISGVSLEELINNDEKIRYD